MSFNLIDLVKDQLSDQVMGQLGNVLGGSAEQNESAISSAIPGLISGLTNLGGTDKGAGSLFNAINDQDDSILDNLGDMLGGSNQSNMMSMGTKALGSLLGGGGLGSLVSAVSGFSGAGKSNTGSLMGLLAPIVFGVVKRKLLGGGGSGFDVGSLMNMFNGQKENVQAAMPSGFADSLKSSGFDKIDFSLADNLSGAADSVKDTVSSAADNVVDRTQEAASEGKSMLGKLLPLALLIGAALIAYNLFFKGGAQEEASSSSATTQFENLDAAGIGSELKNTMGSLTTSFSGITDVDSAKAALPNITSASDNLGGLAGMMAKLPEAAQGPIKAVVAGGMPQIQEMIDKISAIPGVGPIVKPVLDGLTEKLAMFN